MAKKPASDELDALRQMCKEGRVFDVQDWIRQGNPVALKVLPPPGHRRHCPLQIAIDRGNHSLVQVLLEAGAPIEEGNYHALYHAVETRRKDLVALLIEHGANVQDVSMQNVIYTWDPELVDLFVANGASLVDHQPIAYGLICKVRTALGMFKKYVAQQPELINQVETAMRYHVRQGNAKWVSLMLWAGADPWALGPDEVTEQFGRSFFVEDEYTPILYSAVELAVISKQTEILKMKGFLTPPDPKRPESMKIMRHHWALRDKYVIQLLLEHGHLPALYEDRCSDLITGLLLELSSDWSSSRRYWGSVQENRNIDNYTSEEVLEAIGLLFAAGAKWFPDDNDEIKRVRHSLLKMAPKYTFEFVQMVHDHKAARKRDIEELIRTASMTKLLEKRNKKITALVAALPEEPPMDKMAPSRLTE